MRSKVGKLDVDKLEPLAIDLSKLSDELNIHVIKNDVYKVKIKNIEDKIADITNLAANTTSMLKLMLKKKIPSIAT